MVEIKKILSLSFLIINLSFAFSSSFQNNNKINKEIKKETNTSNLILSANSNEGEMLYKSKNKIFKTHLLKIVKLNSNFRQNKNKTRYFLYVFSLKNKNNKEDLKKLFKFFYPNDRFFLEGNFASFLNQKRQTNLKTVRYKRIYDLGIFSLLKDASVLDVYGADFKMKKFLKNKKPTFLFLILEKLKNKKNEYVVRDIFCENFLLKNDNVVNKFKKILKVNNKNIVLLNKNINNLLKKGNVAIICKEITYNVKDKNDIQKLNKYFLKKEKSYDINGKEIKKIKR